MNKNTKKLIIGLIVIVLIGLCVFLNVFGSSKTKVGNREMPDATGSSPELMRDTIVEQSFINRTENIKEVGIVFSRLYFLDEEEDKIFVVIELSCDEKVLASKNILANDIPSEHRTFLDISTPISGYVGKEFKLKIFETFGANTGLALMTSDEYKETYYFDDQKYDGTICFSVIGE